MSKIFAIMVTGLLLVAGNAQAHCGKCGIGDAPKMDMNTMVTEKTEMLTKELKLTDEQKTKVQAIITEKMTKKQELMDQTHKTMEAMHEEFKTKLGGILSAEQMKSWETMMKDSDHMGGKCPMCKDGKMCEMCLLKKNKMDAEHAHPASDKKE